MQKFIPGDKIVLNKSKITEKYINFSNTEKIYFVIVSYLDDNHCLIYNKQYGFVIVDEKYIDFRFLRDKKSYDKYKEEYINKRYASNVITHDGKLVRNANTWYVYIEKQGFYYIAVDKVNVLYIPSVVSISANYIVSDNYNGRSILSIMKYSKITEDYVEDYITKDKFNKKSNKTVSIFEFTSSEIKVHYTKQISNTNTLPRIFIDIKNIGEQFNPSIVSNTYVLGDKFGNNFVFGISVENLIENGYKESLYNGMFFNKKTNIQNKYFGYEEFNNVCIKRLGSKSSSNLSTEGLAYTFGIEIEMQKCFIPHWLRPELNISCVRDGSINNRQGDRNGGPEFVTGVLTGDTGFLHLNSICNQITKRGELDQSCGLHVHIGGASFSEEFLVMSYILGQKLESQFFELVPKSRRNSEYCTRLKNLKFSFNNIESSKDFRTRCSTYYKELFKYLCGSYPDEKVNKNTNHPRGRTCGYDHSSPRYNWLNFVPAVFNTKGSANSWTLEFRIHSGTSNFVKIRNWIKLCMAFVYFADNCHSDIINNCVTINGVKHPLTINNIITRVFPKTSNNLIKYLEDRKSKFSDSVDKEIEEYSHNYQGVLELSNIKEIID